LRSGDAGRLPNAEGAARRRVAQEPEGPCVVGTDRSGHPRCRHEGARRRFSRTPEIVSGAIRQIVVRGRVQGVGYRAWVKHQAELRRLDGWARNRRDGSVEMLLAGQPDALNLRRAGEMFSLLPTI